MIDPNAIKNVDSLLNSQTEILDQDVYNPAKDFNLPKASKKQRRNTERNPI